MALLHDISTRPKLLKILKHKWLALLKIGLERRWLRWLGSAALGHRGQASATWFAEGVTTCSPASTGMLELVQSWPDKQPHSWYSTCSQNMKKQSAEIDSGTRLGHCTKHFFGVQHQTTFSAPAKASKIVLWKLARPGVPSSLHAQPGQTVSPLHKKQQVPVPKNPSNEHKINLQGRLTVQNNWDTKWRKSHIHKIETQQWPAKEEVLDQAGRFEAWWSSISPRGFPPSKTPLTLKFLTHTISHTHTFSFGTLTMCGFCVCSLIKGSGFQIINTWSRV